MFLFYWYDFMAPIMISLTLCSNITLQGPLKKKSCCFYDHVGVVSRLTQLFCLRYSFVYFGQKAVTKNHRLSWAPIILALVCNFPCMHHFSSRHKWKRSGMCISSRLSSPLFKFSVGSLVVEISFTRFPTSLHLTWNEEGLHFVSCVIFLYCWSNF